MHVEAGNVAPILGGVRRNGEQRVTSWLFPEGTSVADAATTVASTWPQMSAKKPVWIESDVTELTSQLRQHFGIKAKDNRRPKDWGRVPADELARMIDAGKDS